MKGGLRVRHVTCCISAGDSRAYRAVKNTRSGIYFSSGFRRFRSDTGRISVIYQGALLFLSKCLVHLLGITGLVWHAEDILGGGHIPNEIGRR